MREVEPHDPVAGLEQRQKDGLVRLRAGMRLHVREGRPEERPRPVDRERLDDVDMGAAAVVALPG